MQAESEFNILPNLVSTKKILEEKHNEVSSNFDNFCKFYCDFCYIYKCLPMFYRR